MDINVSSQIVVQTAAQWAADVTVYSAKRLLVVSDAFFGATDQRKYKLADGVQTFAQLDFIPISGYDDATSSIQTQLNGKQASLGYTAEDSSNKSSSYTLSSTTTYANTKALVDGLATKGSGDALTTNPLSQFAATTSSQLAGVISDETGSGALVFGTSPTFTTDITTPIINPSAFLNIGSAAVAGGALSKMRVGLGTGFVDIGERSAGLPAIWLQQATPTTSNYALLAPNSSDTTLNAGGSAGIVRLAIAGTTKVLITNHYYQFTPAVSSGQSTTTFQFIAPADTAMLASTEKITFNIIGALINFATGALTRQRFTVIDAPTYKFSAASTITTAATLAITGNPVAGANATITNALALWIQSGKVQIDGSITATTYNNTPAEIQLAASDETTALTAGTGKLTFRMPYAMTLTAVRASVTTAATGGTLLTVDINEGGVSILSTKLTFDASEKTTTTAATPAVISDTALADDAEITIDIDAVGNTIAGAGLKVTLIGTRA